PVMIQDILLNMEQTGRSVLRSAQLRVEKGGIPVQTSLIKPAKGSVADAVVKEASRWKADLVAIGTRGWRALDGILMGSTAQSVLRQSKFPLLLVTEASRKAVMCKRILVPIDGSPAAEAGLLE